MNEFHRRMWDGDFHVIEEIVLNDEHVAKISGFKEVEKKTSDPEIKKLLESIHTNQWYYSTQNAEIQWELLEPWDIVEIQFIKDYKQKDISLVMRFFVKMKYSTSMMGYIYIFDESNGFSSKARAEKIALPIISEWKRKIILTESLWEALIISTNQFIHESRIKDIKIYKIWNKTDQLKWKIKWKLKGLFGKK